MRRRGFLRGAAVAGLGSGVLSCDGCDAEDDDELVEPVAEPEPEPELEFFGGEHAAIARLMLNTLIPPNHPEGSPGASDAQVIVFVDRVLRQPAFRRFQRFVRDGLEDLDAASQREHHKPFAEATLDEREALLTSFQTNQVQGTRVPAATFFNVMSTFALEGFWGAPKHGGNHQEVAWQWAGLEVACVMGHDE